jgi:hypothetical protein
VSLSLLWCIPYRKYTNKPKKNYNFYSAQFTIAKYKKVVVFLYVPIAE